MCEECEYKLDQGFEAVVACAAELKRRDTAIYYQLVKEDSERIPGRRPNPRLAYYRDRLRVIA